MFRLWEGLQNNPFPGFSNNKLHVKKKKKKRKTVKEKSQIKKDLRDLEPSQNVDTI